MALFFVPGVLVVGLEVHDCCVCFVAISSHILHITPQMQVQMGMDAVASTRTRRRQGQGQGRERLLPSPRSTAQEHQTPPALGLGLLSGDGMSR